MAVNAPRAWLITYDITDPKRLARLHRFLVRQATPVQPRNGSWTRLLVRLGGCLARSDNAAGSCLQGGATKPGARTGVLAGV